MLIDIGLVKERPNEIGGIQRIYRWGRYGASCINAEIAHAYEFKWEVAILRYFNDDDKEVICYDSGLTEDVEVFMNDLDTNEFLLKIRDFAMDDLKIGKKT